MVHASKLIRQHVAICLQRQLFKEFLSRMWKIVKCNATEAKLEKMSEEEDRTTWPLQKDGKLKHALVSWEELVGWGGGTPAAKIVNIPLPLVTT